MNKLKSILSFSLVLLLFANLGAVDTAVVVDQQESAAVVDGAEKQVKDENLIKKPSKKSSKMKKALMLVGAGLGLGVICGGGYLLSERNNEKFNEFEAFKSRGGLVEPPRNCSAELIVQAICSDLCLVSGHSGRENLDWTHNVDMIGRICYSSFGSCFGPHVRIKDLLCNAGGLRDFKSFFKNELYDPLAAIIGEAISICLQPESKFNWYVRDIFNLERQYEDYIRNPYINPEVARICYLNFYILQKVYEKFGTMPAPSFYERAAPKALSMYILAYFFWLSFCYKRSEFWCSRYYMFINCDAWSWDKIDESLTQMLYDNRTIMDIVTLSSNAPAVMELRNVLSPINASQKC